MCKIHYRIKITLDILHLIPVPGGKVSINQFPWLWIYRMSDCGKVWLGHMHHSVDLGDFWTSANTVDLEKFLAIQTVDRVRCECHVNWLNTGHTQTNHMLQRLDSIYLGTHPPNYNIWPETGQSIRNALGEHGMNSFLLFHQGTNSSQHQAIEPT